MNTASRPYGRRGGYQAIHKWLLKDFGNADKCENPLCASKSKTYQWAKLSDREYEYKRENFIKLCASCHRSYDMTPEQVLQMAKSLAKRTDPEYCRNGHKRTPKNTYLAKRRFVVSKVCRDCRNESQRRYVCKSPV